MIRTYLDSGVLICAARLLTSTEENSSQGNNISQKAINILGEAKRYLICSKLVKMETLPHSIRNKQKEESEFYQAFFDNVHEWVKVDDSLIEETCKQILAENNGIFGIDAMHITCALLGNADEFITSEKTHKPICQVKCIKVISLHEI